MLDSDKLGLGRSVSEFADAEQQFRAAAALAGVDLPEKLEADGKIHRCGDDKECAYIFHANGVPNGGFQNWRNTDGWMAWCSKPSGRQLTATERRNVQARQEADRRVREEEKLKRHKEAARRAADIWRSARPAPANHPYLLKKGILPASFKFRVGAPP